MSLIFSDNDAEKNIAAYLLKDAHVFEEDRHQLVLELFEDTKIPVILSEVFKYYVQYGGIPDEKSFEYLISSSASIPLEKRASYLLFFIELKNRSSVIGKDQFLHDIDILKQLQKRRKLYSIGELIKDGLQRGLGEDEVYSNIVSKIYENDSSTSNVVREGSLKDQILERVAEYQDRKLRPNAYKGIPLGIAQLDQLTSGMLPGELGVIFGRSGAGKSRFLHSVAYNMFARNYNVMYITVEMPYEQVGRLYDSRHFKISSTGLRQGKLSTEEEKKYLEGAINLQNAAGDYYTVDVPQNCTAASLVPIIRKYKARKKLDAVFVDYINIMLPSTKGSKDLAERWGEIARELKGLARKEHLVVFSAVQANRAAAAAKLEEVGQEHVSYSDMVTWHSDLLLFLRKAGLESELQRQIDAVVVKYRDGRNQTAKLGVMWDWSFVGDLDELIRQDDPRSVGLITIQK